MKNVIRKRKAEFWDIFESVCGEDTFFSRHVTVNTPGSKDKRPAESRTSTISDIENSPEPTRSLRSCAIPCSVPSCTRTADSTAASSEDVPKRQRLKLMREIASTNNIEYSDDAALDTLFHGQTNDQLVAQLDDEQPPPATTTKCCSLNYEDLMEFGTIEEGAYERLDKETKLRYCAGIMDNLYRLIGEYKMKPTSLRAIATKYHVNYDHIYDIWRGRKMNKYLTVSRPSCVQNLR